MTGKLYGTLGPACAQPDTLRAMFRAGMCGMRLNLSHGTLQESGAWVNRMHCAAAAEGVRSELIIDLQGPEVRIGALAQPIALDAGGEITLGEDFPVPPCVPEHIADGDELLLDDGQLSLRVLDAAHARCRVERGGLLLPRKSIAIAGRELPAPALTELDRENLRCAARFGVTGVMQPFVRGKEDLLAIRAALRGENAGVLRIFAKVENQTGLHKLNEIIQYSDVIVVARGDLGNAMPLWELPRAQEHIVRACRAAGRAVMVSTQMLHSMQHSAVPTRAELMDVYHAARSGAQYLLLTGETAAGEYPAEAMRFLAETARCGWADAGSGD